MIRQLQRLSWGIRLLIYLVLACFLVWMFTLVVAVDLFCCSHVFGLALGEVSIGIYQRDFGFSLRGHMLSNPLKAVTRLAWLPRLYRDQATWILFIPLWPGVLGLGVATFLVWRRTRARITGNEHCCQLCGYNLRGLTSKRCPECGTAFSDSNEINNQL
jgi:hypothetical protein